MGFFRQLGLLMWKNSLLQRRKICVTIFEVILPLLFAVVFLSLRFVVQIQRVDNSTQYDSFPVVVPRSGNSRGMTGKILYTPNIAITDGLMAGVESALNTSTRGPSLVTMGFLSLEKLLDYYRLNSADVSMALEFDVKITDTTLPKALRYSIRPPLKQSSDRWRTTETFPFRQTGVPRSDFSPRYNDSGFLVVQRLVNQEIINYWNASAGNATSDLDIRLQRMPYPPYIIDPMMIVLQVMLPILLMLSFILMAIQTTKGVVYEKERKLKESMKLMGLSATANWMSWFLTTSIYVVVIMAFYALFCGLDASGNGAALSNGDPFLFFLFLLCYGVSIISYCFMVSVFTHKANIGAAISGIVFFVSYCPYFYLEGQYETMSRSAKLGSCLVFNLGMAFGSKVIGLYEGTGSGIQWSNFDQPASVDDNLSLLDVMLMLLVDSAIHLLITWYVDNVWPGEFGVPKPWYFAFTIAYWCGSSMRVEPIQDIATKQNETYFEKEPNGMDVGISIKNLQKVFGRGAKKKVAVDGMSLNMFEGQISVLLGHNGAGKTTTMSILTGFIPATGGAAIVNGFDIRTDIRGVRQSLGLCPQHDILFDTMTVKEHLDFFANLKGCPKKHVKSEVEKIIHEVGLDHKRNVMSQNLSGGQKRKLSVGIALIGGSKIVILDEPTSGMDPAARRQTWDILQRNRQGRTMLLTTHFMDEADLLGDRIAIMAEGVVKCCGTSYFLKKLYGAGYHLVMVKEPTCQVASVTAVVQQYVPSAVMESEINAELSYLLPDDQSSKFAALFTEIEIKGKELGICSFGTTATTMEEVFLKVEKSQEQEQEQEQGGSAGLKSYVNPVMAMEMKQSSSCSYRLQNLQANQANGEILAFNQGYKRATGLMLELSRFRGLFVKKVLHTWRNRTIALVQLLLPVLFAIAALAVSEVEPTIPGEAPLTLDLAPFGGSFVPYNDGTPAVALTQALGTAYSDQFVGTADTPEKMNLSNSDANAYFLARANNLGIGQYNKKMMIAAEYASNTVAKGYYNGQSFHAISISLSYMMNAMLKHFTSRDHSIITINNPLPFDENESSSQIAGAGLGIGFTVAFCLLFGMAFLTSSFVYFLIKERQVGAKHLQSVSGVGPFVFWLSNLAWDYINYLIPSLVLLVVFAAFQSPAYSDDGRLGIVFLVLLVYGLAVLPFMYVLQYVFKSPATGMVVIIILNIITGLATLLTTFMLRLLEETDLAIALDWVFLVLFPHYNFGKSINDMFVNYSNLDYCFGSNSTNLCVEKPSCCKDSCGDNCLDFAEDYLDWMYPGVGRFVVFMVIQGAVYLLLTLFIEYRIPQRIIYLLGRKESDSEAFSRIESTMSKDADVAEEQLRVSRISAGEQGSDALILKDLYKRYGNFVAVDHLSIGIPEKECFGLLGQNGAGKTTTFKMMTGDVMLTSGNAFLWSYDIKNNTQKVQENMGYCPQFDALIDQMTGRETLTMYARLKGVPENRIKGVCDNLLDIMLLAQYGDKPAGTYSGGNKRKLSTAIALVGDPAFIMLDEPSTGMDPKARRQLWNVLSKVRECGRTLVLTSHSMEECDALCTRLAIMVNGQFVCLGTPQHLKNKFGQGYTLIAKMGNVTVQLGASEETSPAPTQPLIDFLVSTFPNTKVFDDHQGYAHFQVPDTSVSLAQVFTSMEQAKGQFFVEDYSVHQTTLEQVFLTFTRSQNPPKDDNTSLCKGMCCC
ncbi:phospholipid-transporting ATPase ABCA3-like [Haliotis cracherodii]|uniref:phospholipid-transporting ATPase ABCA3-like n=1 Tax=Haliotis cracherodii TaxID=6455 RepID=UPI0039EC42CF